MMRRPGTNLITRHEAAQGSILSFGYMELFIFMLPFGKLFQFSLIGRLYGIDFALILAVLLLFERKGAVLKQPLIMSFFGMLLLWLFGAVVTDVYLGTAFEDWARGWSKIILFGVSFAGLAMLFEGRMDRMVVFMTGFAIASLMETIFVPGEFVADYPWKYGYGPPLTLLVILLAESGWFVARFGRLTGIFCVYAIAAVSFSLNARSLFGLAAVAATFGWAKIIFDPQQRGLQLSNAAFVALVGIGLTLSWGLAEAQSWAAQSGLLGLEAQDKYQIQASGDLGIFLGGRVESLASTQAILDSPIIGHGSWARDIRYVGMLLDTLVVNGLTPSADIMLSDDLIPSHSYLAGAWVEAGLLGGIFWIWIFIRTLLTLRDLISVPTRKAVFMAFLLVSLMWDILFSPFGADRRSFIPVPILIGFWIVQRKNTMPITAKRNT